MPTYRQLSDASDGTILGQSASDKVGFYGVTPVVQASAITSGATTTTEFTAAINAIIAALKNIGITA